MDQDAARKPLEAFLDARLDQATLGLVYGRRRIGKSTLLEEMAVERSGFYWEATRSERALHLDRLGRALGEHLGVGRLAFETWEEAIEQLLRLGAHSPRPVVLDEVGYLLEADPGLDSTFATALGPAGRRRAPGAARLILCGSAMAMMRSLSSGQAPLRGRAGMELVMQPFDYRTVLRHWGPPDSLLTAARVYAVIGGVIGYHTDMVDHDLPGDFDDWVARRVLSPAATLHHEATTLLAEDPILSTASATMHHSILGAIANGSVTAGKIAKRLRRPVPNLDPALKRLIAAGFVVRHADPVRAQRPSYALADPFLQFHYAVLEPHGALLRHRPPHAAWKDRLAHTFDTRVRGPVFEQMARTWVQRYATATTLGGPPDHVGPSMAVVNGTPRELDVVVATSPAPDTPPAQRMLVALGEAKSGETVSTAHLRKLEAARSAFGTRAAHAKLLLFAPAFTNELSATAKKREDVELVDLERLYGGA